MTIHIPCDSIQFRLLAFYFDYFDLIMQSINVFNFLQHDTQCKQIVVLELSVVPFVAEKDMIFPHSGSERYKWIHNHMVICHHA